MPPGSTPPPPLLPLPLCEANARWKGIWEVHDEADWRRATRMSGLMLGGIVSFRSLAPRMVWEGIDW